MGKIDYLIWLGKRLAGWPAPLRLRLAQGLAWLLWRMPNRRRERARENITRCLPYMDTGQQRKILRAHLQHRACALLESPVLWHAPLERLLQLVTAVEGWDVLESAHRRGRGVIVAVPHFGQWELVGLYLSARLNNTGMLYKPPANARLDQQLRQYRERTGGRAVPASAAGIRHLLAILRSGGYAGILPDQRPKSGQGKPALLFDQTAQTMTLLPRLVRRTRCKVVFAGCQRLPDQQSFVLRIIPAPFGIDADDDAIALEALNQGVEQVAAWDLPQYQWSYNRFQ